jgi:hypothetical protein
MSQRRVSSAARGAASLLSALLLLAIVAPAPVRAQDLPCPDDTLVSQPATAPGGDWKAYTSEQFDLLALAENFHVSRDIGAVHWWGFLRPREGASSPDVNMKEFQITIFTIGAGHLPGIMERSEGFVVTPAPTGVYYDNPLWSFSAQLDPPCPLRDGWIVIEGSGSNPGNIFQWITSDLGDGTALRNNQFGVWEWLEGDNLALCLTPAARPEDVNQDGVVDLLDLLLVLGAWGPAPPPCPPHIPADVNADCTVDALDMLAVLTAWGPLP